MVKPPPAGEPCAEAGRARGCAQLEWQTAPDNHTAQRLYDSTGATKSPWLTYELPLTEPSGDQPG